MVESSKQPIRTLDRPFGSPRPAPKPTGGKKKRGPKSKEEGDIK